MQNSGELRATSGTARSGKGQRAVVPMEEMKVMCGGRSYEEESASSITDRTPAMWGSKCGRRRLKLSSHAICTMCVNSRIS